MIKAVVFDIGRTLVSYKMPLNWSELYRPAFESVAGKCRYTFEEHHYQHAAAVLAKYNTRINPREKEASSNQIFSEIISGMGIPPEDIEKVKFCFYSFFKQDAYV